MKSSAVEKTRKVTKVAKWRTPYNPKVKVQSYEKRSGKVVQEHDRSPPRLPHGSHTPEEAGRTLFEITKPKRPQLRLR